MIPVDNDDPMLYLLAEILQGDVEWEALDEVLSSDAQIEMLQKELSRCKAMIAKLTVGNEEDERHSAARGFVDDAYYFDGYGHLSIHEVMLRDKSRTIRVEHVGSDLNFKVIGVERQLHTAFDIFCTQRILIK